MKGSVESIHGDTIKISKESSNNRYIRIQMNYSGFAYLDYTGIEKLQIELESAKRKLLKRQEKEEKKKMDMSQLSIPFE